MMSSPFAAVLAALAVAPASDRPDEPVGGYWDRGELDTEPPDGHERVYTGAILLPLGVIATVAGSVSAYITSPGRCQEYLSQYDPSDEECQGLFIFNLTHTAIGGLMMISGGVILAIGLRQRHENREWRRRRGLSVAPLLGGGVSGVSLRMRF